MKYFVCNLKNKMNKDETIKYTNSLKQISCNKLKLIFIPSYPFINYFSDTEFSIGSQDISSFNDKTITGEVNGNQLQSLGVSYVLIGHSERREYKKEINIDFINKINHAQESNLNIIYCIGESLEEKENGNTYMVLEKQISEVLNNVEIKNIIIAYEPVWSIGTGIIPEYQEIKENIEFIKDIVEEKYDIPIKVLYGGSVNVDNIKDINKIKGLDGFLIGSASLNFENVTTMIDSII